MLKTLPEAQHCREVQPTADRSRPKHRQLKPCGSSLIAFTLNRILETIQHERSKHVLDLNAQTDDVLISLSLNGRAFLSKAPVATATAAGKATEKSSNGC